MKKTLILIGIIAAIGFISILSVLAHAGGTPLLFPSGAIGIAERNLMVRTVLLMLIVVIPVFALIIAIGWRYRASNVDSKATYTPNWEHSTLEEFIWWIIPFEIVLVLSAVTWTSTHALAPERKIESTQAPLTVQVVALPWKWLFIYPEEGVASVNELALPVDRPVTFQITADAPMNSFWIPALGGQEYAMSGMVTELNLIANKPGEYPGMSANYSGEGFAQMNFTAHAMDDPEFAAWVANAKTSGTPFDHGAYTAIAKPGDAGPTRYYSTLIYPFMNIVSTSMGMVPSSGMMQGMTGNMQHMDMQ